MNIGSGHTYTIGEVARLLARAYGRPDLQPQIMGKARAGDIRHCYADIDLARRTIGYSPQFRLEDGLEALLDWVVAQEAVDRVDEAAAELERRGLVA